MGVQDTGLLSEGTGRVSTAELLVAANDPTVTERTLEFWRHEGLLPKAQRTGQHGKQPVWTYPAQAVDQLVALQRLRAKTKDPDLLRTALWFEGFDVDTSRVGASIAAFLSSCLKVVNKEIDKRRPPDLAPEDARWAAFGEVAQVLARKRGPKALPRLGRQRLEDREHAMELGIGLMMGDGGATARIEVDGAKLERLVGVDRGRKRRGGLPAWLDGPPSDGFEAFARFGSLPSLIDTASTASEDELQASRMLARILLDGVNAFARMTEAIAGVDNPSGFAAMTLFRDNPMATAWLLALLVGISRSSELSENLKTVVEALTGNVLPTEARARELAKLSPEDLQRELPNLSRLPFIDQVRVDRLIAQYRGEACQLSQGAR